MEKIRLLIVTPDDKVGRSLAVFFERDGGFLLGGLADEENGAEAARALQPDVIVYGPVVCTEERGLVSAFKDACPLALLVVVGIFDETRDAARLLDSDADVLLSWPVFPGHLVQAINLACNTAVAIIPRALKEVLLTSGQVNGEANGVTLTPREQEVYDLVFRNYRNRDIARALFLSESTVKAHIRSILRKLGATNRLELLVRHKRVL